MEKIISFENVVERKRFNSCVYEGSVTITIQGKSIKEAMYLYELDEIEEEDLEYFLLDTLNSLMQNQEERQCFEKSILNTSVTIYFFSPPDETDNYFYYEWEPDISEEQLSLLLSCCILNLRE